MHPDCLAHRLTDDERRQFETSGYLSVPNALDPATNARLLAVADRLDVRERTPRRASKLMSLTDVIKEDPALVD